MSTTATAIPLARIYTDDNDQPRGEGVDDTHVALLVASDPDGWPPILVTPSEDGEDGPDYFVVDGWHRLAAARVLGLPALPCIINPDAGYPEAVAANLKHGLPLSVASRKRYARRLRDDEPELSLREIGRRCGLSHITVRTALEEARGQINQPVPEGQAGPRATASHTPGVTKATTRMVRLAIKAVEDKEARVGLDGRTAEMRHILGTYPEAERLAAAEAIRLWGTAMVKATER